MRLLAFSTRSSGKPRGSPPTLRTLKRNRGPVPLLSHYTSQPCHYLPSSSHSSDSGPSGIVCRPRDCWSVSSQCRSFHSTAIRPSRPLQLSGRCHFGLQRRHPVLCRSSLTKDVLRSLRPLAAPSFATCFQPYARYLPARCLPLARGLSPRCPSPLLCISLPRSLL